MSHSDSEDSFDQAYAEIVKAANGSDKPKPLCTECRENPTGHNSGKCVSCRNAEEDRRRAAAGRPVNPKDGWDDPDDNDDDDDDDKPTSRPTNIPPIPPAPKPEPRGYTELKGWLATAIEAFRKFKSVAELSTTSDDQQNFLREMFAEVDEARLSAYQSIDGDWDQSLRNLTGE